MKTSKREQDRSNRRRPNTQNELHISTKKEGRWRETRGEEKSDLSQRSWARDKGGESNTDDPEDPVPPSSRTPRFGHIRTDRPKKQPLHLQSFETWALRKRKPRKKHTDPDSMLKKPPESDNK